MPSEIRRVLGVLAGEDMPLAQLRSWAESAELIMAADSGADRLLAAGAHAHILVGDLDSVTDEGRRSTPEVYQVAEQETTDCDKLLSVALEKGYGALTLISVEGSQPDHELSTLRSAARSPLDVRIAYRRGIGRIMRAGSDVEIEVATGARISLVPMVDCAQVMLEGVKWSLVEQTLSPLGRVSISNEALGGGVRCSLSSGAALLYVELGPNPIWP